MATQALKLKAEALRSLSYSALSTTFAALGSAFAHPARIIHLQNLTDVNIIYSFDGSTNHGVVAAGNFLLLDVTANKTLDQGEFIAQGTTIYIALISGAAAPTLGNVYLSMFYGAQS